MVAEAQTAETAAVVGRAGMAGERMVATVARAARWLCERSRLPLGTRWPHTHMLAWKSVLSSMSQRCHRTAGMHQLLGRTRESMDAGSF